MGKLYDAIDDKLAEWLLAQPVYFVATAPRDGHVNLSPKGMAGTFAVLGPSRVGYLDYYGSGIETIAHLRENGRIVVMLCAFDGPPKIVRLHGTGRAVFPGDADFATLRAEFTRDDDHALRSVIVVDLDRISDSCGYAVPKLTHVADRDVLDLYHAKKPAQHWREEYGPNVNAASIDGLPGLA